MITALFFFNFSFRSTVNCKVGKPNNNMNLKCIKHLYAKFEGPFGITAGYYQSCLLVEYVESLRAPGPSPGLMSPLHPRGGGARCGMQCTIYYLCRSRDRKRYFKTDNLSFSKKLSLSNKFFYE